MASVFKLRDVSIVRIIHFGPNPVRGGRPPRDKIIRGVNAVSAGALVHDVESELIL